MQRKDASEIETVAEDHLGDQVIGGTCDADTQAKVDFPVGREIEVDGGEYLVLLLTDGVKARDGT